MSIFKKILPIIISFTILFQFSSISFAQEKVLKLSVATEPIMDPAFVTDSYSIPIVKNLFEGLTRPTNDGDIVPAMADSWDISEDGLTYTFNLRDNIQWSNGDPVTANDFEYSWKRIINPASGSPSASKLFFIKGAQAYYLGEGTEDEVGIKALDDTTFEVILNSPMTQFIELTARQVTLMPVHSVTAQSGDSWATEAGEQFVTNGPFTLTEWVHSGNYVLTKSSTYWDKENVDIDGVSVQIIEDPMVANMSYQNGELDFIGIPFNTIPADMIHDYQDSGELITTQIGATYMYKLNTTDKVMSNANIRRALSLAINRQDLIDHVVKGNQTPALGGIAPTVEGFKDDRAYFKDADYETARSYLAMGLEELGEEDAANLPIIIQTNANDTHMAVAQYIQNGWAKELGINATIETAEINVHFDSMNNLDYQIARVGPTVDYNDAYAFLDHYYDKSSTSNRTGWEDANYQAILDEMAQTTDSTQRQSLALEAEAILMDAMPFIPIYYYSNPQIVREGVEGLVVDGMVDIQLKEVTIK